MNTYYLLGAEKQAATSIALAYPNLQFVFFSDCSVIDGHDLDNVLIKSASEFNFDSYDINQVIPLCNSWYLKYPQLIQNSLKTNQLNVILDVFFELHPESVLQLEMSNNNLKHWISKGNYFHKPDAVEYDTSNNYSPKDIYNCGILYQEYKKAGEHFICTGYRTDLGGIKLTNFIIYRESFARDEILLAGETLEASELNNKMIHMLEHIKHVGFFTFNYIKRDNEFYITSFRAIPKAVFSTLLNADIDCLEMDTKQIKQGVKGKKFIVDSNYSTY